MASPNTGIFASSFIEGFLGQRKDQEDRNQRNKIIKMQAKLIEAQLATVQGKIDAQTKLSDLLTGSVGEFEQIGKTAPAPSGSPLGEDGRQPVPQFESTGQEPMSVAEALSDPEGFLALMQSGQIKIGDLIGKPQQDTTLSRNLQAAGFQPGTGAFQEQMLKQLDANADDDVLAQLVLSQQKEKLNEQRHERELIERTEGEEKIGRRQAVRNDFGNAKRIIELQTDLANTFAAAGIPFGEAIREGAAGLNAIFGAIGFDVSKSTEIIAKRDELIKLFADGTLEAIDRFKGTGTITNQKFDALVAASPEIGKSALANARVLAARMQAAIDAAERKEEIIPNRAEITAWIAEMKRGPITKATERAKDGAETASAFAKRQFEAAKNATGNAAEFAEAQFNKAKPVVGAAVERAKPVVADSIKQAKGVANAVIERLQAIDFNGMSREAKQRALDELSQIDPKQLSADAKAKAITLYDELYNAINK